MSAALPVFIIQGRTIMSKHIRNPEPDTPAPVTRVRVKARLRDVTPTSIAICQGGREWTWLPRYLRKKGGADMEKISWRFVRPHDNLAIINMPDWIALDRGLDVLEPRR